MAGKGVVEMSIVVRTAFIVVGFLILLYFVLRLQGAL